MFQRLALASLALAVASTGAFAQITKPAPAAATKPTLVAGSPAPALSIEKWVKGSPVANFEKGKIYVVEFWATWCGPCKASMPHLSELQREYKSKGVTIIGVTSTDKNGNNLDGVEQMVADKGDTMGYTVAWDTERKTSDAFMTAAGQHGIPCAFVVDGTGTVVYIGHPMFLELPLQGVVAGTWNAEKGKEIMSDVNARMSKIYGSAGTDAKGSIAQIADFAAKYPELAHTFDSLEFSIFLQAGDMDSASKLGGKLVDDAIAANDSAALNQIAWSIVDPEAKIAKRDLALALRAAEKGVELTKEKDWALLDTLARVYFTKGDAKKAIEFQQKAVEGAPDKAKDELKKTLDTYKAKRAQ